jgi:hypothetical protein
VVYCPNRLGRQAAVHPTDAAKGGSRNTPCGGKVHPFKFLLTIETKTRYLRQGLPISHVRRGRAGYFFERAAMRALLSLRWVAFVVCMVSVGCAAVPGDLEGESVTIRVLDKTALTEYADKHTNWTSRQKEAFNAAIAPVIGENQTFGTELIGPVVNLAFDFIKDVVAREAALYQRQYGATIYEDGYWHSRLRDRSGNGCP